MGAPQSFGKGFVISAAHQGVRFLSFRRIKETDTRIMILTEPLLQGFGAVSVRKDRIPFRFLRNSSIESHRGKAGLHEGRSHFPAPGSGFTDSVSSDMEILRPEPGRPLILFFRTDCFIPVHLNADGHGGPASVWNRK